MHLRKRHGVESGGKTKTKRGAIDLSFISLKMDNSTVREMLARELHLLLFVRIFPVAKSLRIFSDTLPSVVKILHQANSETFAILVPDDIVNPLWISKMPFDLEPSLFAPVNLAQYGVDGVPEMIIADSIPYSVGDLLAEVISHIMCCFFVDVSFKFNQKDSHIFIM